jgi:hypothetical protein
VQNISGHKLREKLREIGTLTLALAEEISLETEIKKSELDGWVGRLIKLAVIGGVVTAEQVLCMRKPMSDCRELVKYDKNARPFFGTTV